MFDVFLSFSKRAPNDVVRRAWAHGNRSAQGLNRSWECAVVTVRRRGDQLVPDDAAERLRPVPDPRPGVHSVQAGAPGAPT